MVQLYQKLIGLLNKMKWLPQLLAQITIGIVFVESGWGKLHNLPKVIAFFTTLGIPAPQLQAPFVAGVEFVCGALVLIGLATRLASIPLIGTMVVAILTAKLADFETWTDLFGASEFLYIVILIYLVTSGPSPVSVDHVIQKKCAKA